MPTLQKNKTVLILSLLLAALITLISSVGLLVPGFYAQETANWATQAVGQDGADLFLIMPCLVGTAWLSYKNNKAAQLLWGGVLFYLVYTYVVYSFGLHLNNLFIVYCLTLGLSFYLFLYFLFVQHKKQVATWFSAATPVRTVGIYLMAVAVLFYALWLSELLPALLYHTTPQALTDTGLPVNPIHALDLSVCLPALFIAGISLLKKRAIGYVLAPVMLLFCLLMDITIGALAVLMYVKDISTTWTVAVIMAVLALISLVLLIRFFSSMTGQQHVYVFKTRSPALLID